VRKCLRLRGEEVSHLSDVPTYFVTYHHLHSHLPTSTFTNTQSMSTQSKHKHPEDLAAADVDLLTTALTAFEKIKGDVEEDKEKKEVITAFNRVFEDIGVLLVSSPKIVCSTFLSLLCVNNTFFRKHLSQVLNQNTSN
jgi:hypothetical protein